MRMFLHQLRGEQLLFWRSREAAIFIFLFPILLLLLVGALYTGKIEGHRAASVLLIGMLGYGVANTAFSGLAIGLIIDREQGILKRIRATPLPSITFFAALLVSTLLVFALESVVLVLVGHFAYNAQLPERAPFFAFVLVVGALAFAGFGLGVASLVRSGTGSSAVINVIIVPMAFLSGSFGQTRRYPYVLRVLGDMLPLKHLIAIAKAVGLDHGSLLRTTDFAVLLAWGAGGVLVAARSFSWEPRAA